MNERSSSDADNEPTPEMTPRLSEADYDAAIEALSEWMLHRLADDDTGALMLFDKIEIRPILSETEEFHRNYPISAIEHGESEPSPGAWSWIDDAVPKEALRRQALDIVTGDVYKCVKQFAESEEHTYRQNETTYVRETVGRSETEPSDEGDGDSTSDNSENEPIPERENEADGDR